MSRELRTLLKIYFAFTCFVFISITLTVFFLKHKSYELSPKDKAQIELFKELHK